MSFYLEPQVPDEVIDKFNAIPNTNPIPAEDIRKILDSGNRREFGTGAVRDIQEGKGRCDLMPLDVVAHYIGHNVETDCVLKCISKFQEAGALRCLYDALDFFRSTKAWSREHLCLEVAKHFEEGAKKYGENNWQKGIPVHCYIDSGVRHYLKFLRGDTDEPHDRAFCWNIMCAIWTCKHKPELNEYSTESVVKKEFKIPPGVELPKVDIPDPLVGQFKPRPLGREELG